MNRRAETGCMPGAALLSVLLLSTMASKAALAAETVAKAQPVLSAFKKIGMAWPVDKTGWMNFVAFKSDGRFIASDASANGDVSGDLTLWSFPEGKLIKRLPGKPTAVSPDWKFYATAHGIRTMESGASVVSLGDSVFAAYAFAPNGTQAVQAAATGAKADPKIRLIDLKTKRYVRSFGKHRAFALAISPEGKVLATGHWKTVTFWDLGTGRRLAALHGADGYVSGMDFSRNGRFLAIGTDRGQLQIWNVENRTRLQSVQGIGGDVQPAFSPDARFVAAGTYGAGSVSVVDVGTGRIVDRRRVSDQGCGSVAFSPDGRFLATPSTGGLIRWPYDLGGTVRVFRFAPTAE